MTSPTAEDLIIQRLDVIIELLQALTKTTQAERLVASSVLTGDQLDALAIDAIGNVPFDIRNRPEGRFCEVSRKAIHDYLTDTMGLARADAYAVNDHIGSRPAVEKFRVRNAVWFRWPEEAELFAVDPSDPLPGESANEYSIRMAGEAFAPVGSPNAEVVELKPATPRRII